MPVKACNFVVILCIRIKEYPAILQMEWITKYNQTDFKTQKIGMLCRCWAHQMYISRSLIKHLHCIHSRKLVIPVGSCARIKMQAREVGQICTQNINKSIRLLYYCNPTFFATKVTTELWVSTLRGAKKILKKAKSNFSILCSQSSFFLVLHTHIFVCFPSLLPLRFPRCYEHPSLWGGPFLTGEICTKSEIKN